ncbi:MAG TPA: RidA family protein [Gemmatimonadales bacterium]|nr:RidA family protein [Gemmatimonadales bacterium]
MQRRVTEFAALFVSGVVGLGVAGCAVGMGGPSSNPGVDMSHVEYINPGTLPSLQGFSHAVKIGPVIYISGEIPVDSTGALIGGADVKAQMQQALRNLLFVVHIAGARPNDVAKLTIHVVGLDSTRARQVHEAVAEVFTPRYQPAGVIVGVQTLPHEGVLVAVDAVAVARAMFYPKDAE